MTEAEKRIIELLTTINEAVSEVKALSVKHNDELWSSDHEAILFLAGANWERQDSGIVCEAAHWLKCEVNNGCDDNKAI